MGQWDTDDALVGTEAITSAAMGCRGLAPIPTGSATIGGRSFTTPRPSQAGPAVLEL